MKNRDRERIWVSKILRVVGWVLVALLILIVFRAWRAGVFTSLDKMEAYIGRFGIWSPFVFIIYQIMQIVVIPFIPGGVTTTAGVVMFGPVEGLSQGKKFEIFFAICIFLPFAPDDLLCFLAGLTEMSYKKFITIILLGKLPVIIGYSISLNMISNWLTAIIR